MVWSSLQDVYKNDMRSRIWLVLWIVGILFPMAFLGRLWPAFGQGFNFVFASDVTHIIFHTFLYAVLAILLGQWIRPVSLASRLKIFGLTFLVGFLHEGLQILLAGQWPGWPAELLDISVDLFGAALGLALVKIVSLYGIKKRT
jgi:hypothetical protein